MNPSTILRNIRTRRLVKTSEKRSGQKQDQSVFRNVPKSTSENGKEEEDRRDTVVPLQPAITMTMSEDSEFSNDPVGGGAAQNMIQEVEYDKSNVAEATLNASQIAHMKLLVAELTECYEGRLAAKDRILHQMKEEMERAHQDFLDVIVDLNAKEQELATVHQNLDDTLHELNTTKAELQQTKDKLHVVSVTLIQSQHKLHEIQEKQQGNVMETISVIGRNLVGYWN